jgi:hypothetical protein
MQWIQMNGELRTVIVSALSDPQKEQKGKKDHLFSGTRFHQVLT